MAEQKKEIKAFRPSSAPALLECACFVSGQGGSDANVGTLMHEYAEALVMGDDELTDDAFLAKYPDLGIEHKEACEWGAAEIKAWCADIAPGYPVLVEQFVEVRSDNGMLITSGTQDICATIAGGDIKGGLDYKPHRHDYHAQQYCYALGAMQKHGLKEIPWFEIYLLPHKFKPYPITYEEASTVVELVYRRVTNPERTPQICSHCGNCAKFLTCSAVNRSLKKITRSYKDLVPADMILDPSQITDPVHAGKALTFVRQILKKYASSIKTVAERVEDRVMELNDSGVDIPGWQRKMKAGSQFVSDYNRAFGLSKVSEDGFYGALSMSIPKLADAYYKEQNSAGYKVTKTAARSEVEGHLAPVLMRKAPTPILEPED